MTPEPSEKETAMPTNNDNPHNEAPQLPRYGSGPDISRLSDAERDDRTEKTLQPGLTQVDYWGHPEV